MMEFLNKVVIVTGAAGGIGRAACKKFAEAGANVVLVDLNMEALEKTANELELQHGKYLLISANVTKEADVENYVKQTTEKFGGIDVFFNNAGIEGPLQLLGDYSEEGLNQVLDVNVKGVFFGLKHVINVMKEQRAGTIINTASAGAKAAIPFSSAYIASKAAVIGLTKAAAIEYSEFGIRVNAICPGPTNTRFMRSVESTLSPDNPEGYQAAVRESVPLGRYAEPSDIAETVLFLASERASYITGSDVDVEGGYLAK